MNKIAYILFCLLFSFITRAQTLADIVGTYSLSIQSDGKEIIFSNDNDSIYWKHQKKQGSRLDRLDTLILDMHRTERLTIRSDATYQYSRMNKPWENGKVNMLEDHIFLFPSSGHLSPGDVVFEYKVVNQKVQLKSKKKDYKIYLKE